MKLDITLILEQNRAFYQGRGLADWADALPRKGEIPAADAGKIIWAERAGWDEIFTFPPFDLQMATLDRVVEETARKPAPGLPDDHQYSQDPFLADIWTRTANGKVSQRRHDLAGREQGPYLFVFSRQPVMNAWGRTGKQIVELFEEKGWQGLTVPEYLVLQRQLCERERHHRFIHTEDEPRGHSLWLVDSATSEKIAIATSNQRGINLQAGPLTHRDARRAAVAGLVVPVV